MKRWLNGLFCLSVLVACAGSWNIVQAQQAVYCTNCGTEWTQLANKLSMAKQLAQQATQIQNQIKQLSNMALNTNGVSQHLWGNAMQDIQKLNGILQQSKALSYSAGNLDAQFAQKYQGYQGYASSKLGANGWQNKYNQWSKEASDNALYALKAANAQNTSMQGENALMQNLQAMSQTAQGRMEAMQIANMMAAQSIEQVQKLRQLMMTQLQMQANYYQLQQDKEDAARAATERFFRPTNFNSRDGKNY